MSDLDFSPSPVDPFAPRHLGPSDAERDAMLATVGAASLDELTEQTVPKAIRLGRELDLPAARGENDVLRDLADLASKNDVRRALIGMGYYGCLVPGVILRNVMENPSWYTQYTPYQAEIAQGRLEALFNFQTVVSELTGLELAGASLLDEGTAAAEAMHMVAGRAKSNVWLVSDRVHPHTVDVLRTRAAALDLEVVVTDVQSHDFDRQPASAVLVQYPDTYGRIDDFEQLASRAHAAGAGVVCATDLLALTLLRAPGEWGADAAVGSAQRFGVPLGFGGPHAGFLAAKDAFKRSMPGRIIGLSKDQDGGPALRMAMQTREQHIRRDKATSNICTAQVLLANMAGFYAVYHGPDGLERIARRVRGFARALAHHLSKAGWQIEQGEHFDTLRVGFGKVQAKEAVAAAAAAGFELRPIDADTFGISLDERTTAFEVEALLAALGAKATADEVRALALDEQDLPAPHRRTSTYMEQTVFHDHRSEHAMLRYLKRLESRDLSLVHSMIPLGSCTMKLNATTEMIPVTWSGFADLHPFAPEERAAGYLELIDRLESALAEITGLPAVSLQPNAGSQGEYAGLLAIRGYHRANGEDQRRVCLIPTSAHGTNPASAVMAGMRVVPVRCDEKGNIDLADLTAKADAHANELGALMITYPSTHGVFEDHVREVCEVVHRRGGQVYLDGANMNALVGLCRPGDFGADVCHLNLHKTFCIPHGGGGPGVGPIAAQEHLRPHLPGHRAYAKYVGRPEGAVSSAPFGSAGILPISYAYIAMMGPDGLRLATQTAILSANYMSKRLEGHYDVLYRGRSGRCAHEFILDLRPFEKSAHVTAEDVAKRLMDYGFHAPTMSWPVQGTVMIEPTESEPLAELDRFVDAMIAIRGEIAAIERGEMDAENNPLARAPHTAAQVTSDAWDRPYSRELAAFPAPWNRQFKFWPHVTRIDNGYGDKHLVCTCPTVEEVAGAAAAR
ncbi:MAG: aminomethyl-transferring glycine dehydrogenase [Planctomycetota bacterium]